MKNEENNFWQKPLGILAAIGAILLSLTTIYLALWLRLDIDLFGFFK